MKKIIQVLLPVIRGFVLCAAALQIVLGVIYIGKNFMAVPQFRDTTIYLEMAERFVVDEYTGILYPLLVKLCSSIAIIPYQIPIYLIQIAAGVYCVYHFIYTWTERSITALVCALWVNTIPFVAQAHVTVLPHSLAMACLVVMILQVLRGSVNRRPLTIPEWAELLCSFVILAQLDRAYLIPGMLFVIWGACLQFYNATHKWMLLSVSLLIGISMVVINLAIYDAVQTPGHYGRIQRSFASAFFQRTGVITLNGKYLVHMPEEISQCFTDAELNEIGKYPYKIETEFGPTLEARYGEERADELYMALGKLGLATATKDNILEIAEDLVSYAIPLADYVTWQDGELKGATSWNYQQFMGQAPEFAADYVRICNFLWLLGFGTSMAVCAVLAVRYKKYHFRIWVPMLICLVLYAGYFAMGGMETYDYKLSLLPMIMSCAPMGFLVFKYIFEEV